MKSNYIIFDADGVLLDTLPYIIKWFLINVPNFDISKLLKFKMDYLVDEFGNNFNAFSNIPPIKGAVDFVKRLSQNYKIDVISAYGGNVRRFIARTQNIHKYFGNSINSVINMPPDESKEILYNQYKKGTVVIDDDMSNCQKAFELGLRPFYYRYYFSVLNRKSPKVDKEIRNKIPSVSKYSEIEKYLLTKEH